MWWRAVAVVFGAALVAFGATFVEDPWVTRAAQRPVAIATLPCANANQATSSGFVIDDRTVVPIIFRSVRFRFADLSHQLIFVDRDTESRFLGDGDQYLRAPSFKRCSPLLQHGVEDVGDRLHDLRRCKLHVLHS